MNTNFRFDPDTQTVAELWESLLILTQGRVEDNKASLEYPAETRDRQLTSAQALIDALKMAHAKMKTRKPNESHLITCEHCFSKNIMRISVDVNGNFDAFECRDCNLSFEIENTN
jgi:hypothetical protein